MSKIKEALKLETIDDNEFTWTPPEIEKREDKRFARHLSRKSSTRNQQIAIQNSFQQLSNQSYTIFHLSLTYKPYGDKIYTQSNVDTFFKNFYLKGLLPHLFHGKRSWTQVKKKTQPIVYAFVDEGYLSKVKLHHHVIIASGENTTAALIELTGTNTMTQFASKIETSDLKVSDADTVLYASKMLEKYPDFLCFGYR